MPEIRIKIQHEGQLVDAVDVPIVDQKELWNEYQLEDGSTMRVKFAVGSIVRVEGKFDPEGNPAYAVKGTVVTIPIVPEHLKKRI